MNILFLLYKNYYQDYAVDIVFKIYSFISLNLNFTLTLKDGLYIK